MRIYQKLTIILFVAMTCSCSAPTVIPMNVVEYRLEPPEKEKHLLVLLRGIGGSHESFAEYGLIEEIRKRKAPFDIIAPDAHFGYYKNESVQHRIHQDIVLPARESGYQSIWLAGFSMGGLGSLFYLRDYAEHVDGVMLICPFLGWSGIIEEISSAGGVKEWQATTDDTRDWERLIWSWIKEYQESREEYPPVFLGYGRGDFLAGGGPALLATALPSENTFTVSGGHNYATFRKVFLKHLDRLGEQTFSRRERPVAESPY